jgi:hypothetical protein
MYLVPLVDRHKCHSYDVIIALPVFLKDLTTKWRFIVSWHDKASSACSIYRLKANRNAAIKCTGLCFYDELCWISETQSAVEEVKCYLVATVPDMNDHY